ncbi:MAG: RagB/SusD family nutrient uptake outer membrane protein [Bacteroidales bacterium]|nr:RagB/SusD family nutrient uptake outer membrane protein [Bacteroidales bacterium]
MKRYFLHIIITGITAGLYSCDRDLLDTIPNDRISSAVYWQTPDDALLAINSAYGDLEGVEIFSYDALTDIAHTNDPFNVQANIEKGVYDALNTVIYSRWTAAYKGIESANYFLENVDRISDLTPALKTRYKAEARTLRAYQYIRLLPLFGDLPKVERTLTLDEARQLTRTPAAELWAWLDSQLQTAADSLPETYDAANTGRITKWAALGLKARAALLAGNYRTAADAATQIISSQQFSLYPKYEHLFSYEAENNAEVILDRQFIKGSYANSVFNLLAPYSQNNANNSYVPTKALIDLYQTAGGVDIATAGSGYDPSTPYDNRDPRLRFSIFIDGDILPNGDVFHSAPNSDGADAVGKSYRNTTTGFTVKKYVNADDFGNGANCGINIILLRYAEVLLTYAEAKIELNEIDPTVYDAINLVRNGRDDVKLQAVSGLSQPQLREVVRRERTVELAFEGLHLADIRRWRTAETVLPGKILGLEYDDNGTRKVVEVASAVRTFRPDRDYLWPIPQKERDLCNLLTQNPNWGE